MPSISNDVAMGRRMNQAEKFMGSSLDGALLGQANAGVRFEPKMPLRYDALAQVKPAVNDRTVVLHAHEMYRPRMHDQIVGHHVHERAVRVLLYRRCRH